MDKYLFTAIFLIVSCQRTPEKKFQEDWFQLFNGKSLSGWVPKFAGYPLGENFNHTFRISDSLLQVNYSEYDSFRNEFGHLFYKDKFSHYRLRAVYRSVGTQPPGGEQWAYRNNGLMLHCQNPETILLDQEFPLSIEFQLLGGRGEGNRPNGNLCTPGCNVKIRGEVYVPHCVENYAAPTYHGDQWITVEALVLGDSIIQHIVEGDTVLTYSQPIVGGELFGIDTTAYPVGTRLVDGFIAIQAESHPFDFKKIELLNLCGCTDPKAENYKPYYIKSDSTQCKYGS